MTTLEQIKQLAKDEAKYYEIDWDRLSDPYAQEDLEAEFDAAKKFDVSTCEMIYERLSQGLSPIAENQTALSPEVVDQYMDEIAEQLHAVYILRDLEERYNLIKSITN